MLGLFAEVYQTLGLCLNIKKTQVLYQPAPGHGYDPIPFPPQITIEVDHGGSLALS